MTRATAGKTSRRSTPSKAVEVPPRLWARTAITDLKARGSLPTSEVARAVARVEEHFAQCYRKAAKRAGRDGFGGTRVQAEIDLRGRARDVHASGGRLPGLDACVAKAAARVVTRRRPDIGTVKASWKVEFRR